ncbi:PLASMODESMATA CALLOSE-BINDING PROTEIN 5-like isoform X2 [Primulina huaijiensis]|uniref:PLASMODESMATA CALLOSE-BINDING PROTEIN 5-like isoform X2 n=1 Tax=Primulina huaijiensis TaxID=1492673 RepID=UPI003CC75A56
MGAGFFAGVLHIFLLCLISDVSAAQGGGVPSLELWCVAKNNAEDSALQSALDWACGSGGANCAPIQNGGPCYDASNIPRMASFAFNDYFIKNGLTDDSCNFSNTAALTSLNPSYKNCKFPSSKGNVNLNGSATAGATADMSASNSISRRRWDLGSISICLLFSIPLVIL